MKPLLSAIFFLLLSNPVLCVAKNSELLCSYNVATDDGRFKIVASDSLKVLEQVSVKGTFLLPIDAPKNIVAIMCARSSSLPVIADALVLKAGFSLYIASADDLGGRVLLNLEVSDNKAAYKIVSGTLSDEQTLSLAKIIAGMNQAYFNPAQAKS